MSIGDVMQKNKLKAFLIYKMLEERSDEENPLTTNDIIDGLAEYGIECERKSVYTHVDALNELGCDIIKVFSPKRGYFLANRRFEIPEVVLLIDAVTSAGFITPKKTKSLVEKLKCLVSNGQAHSLFSRVYVETNSAKCDNEEIYITIDRLHEAISEKKKVKFVYKRRSIDVENKKKYTEKTFRVSPYALIWKDDHYYLVCNHEKYDNLMNLRIDRIKKLNILSESARPVSEVSCYKDTFDAQDYSSHMFNMFSGEKCSVKLRCALHLQEEMIDRFGPSIRLTANEVTHFETTVDATISDGFVSWLMQYGDDIKVLEPKALADMVKKRAKAILKVYTGR